MDPNPWSPFKKALSLPSCGSPQTSFTLPPSPPEDSLDKYYAVRTSNSMIHSSDQLLNGSNQLAEPPIRLSHPHYEPLLTPPMHPSKEIADFYSDTLYNGVCKENQPTEPNFLQASGTHSQNENVRFPISEDSVDGYGSQEQPLPFRPSAIDGPSPGPFGVLPHEAVWTRPVATPEATRTCPSRYERNNKFVRPVSKTASASYNRGPYVKASSKAVSAVYNSRSYAEPGSKAVSGTYNNTPCVKPGSKAVSSVFNNGTYAERGSKTVSSIYNSSPYVEPVSKTVPAVYSSGPYSEPVSASYTSGPYSEPVSKTGSASYNSGQFAEPVSKTASASYNSGSFAEPVSKTVSSSYKSGPFVEPVAKTASASHSSGSYAERDANSKSSSVPLSTQSNALSGDKAVRSPVVTSVSVTSPNISNYSSPSDYFPSPKPTVGAYNNAPSPVPQIEEPSASSVDQHSYPSSPFTNVEGNGLVSTAPPCSPMAGSPYVNNLNQVSQRNGLKSQQSPSSVGSNSVMCYNTQQSQNIVTHTTVTSKTSDYHSDYAVYGVHDHNASVVSSSPFSYAPMHSGQMTMGNDSVMSPQPHSQSLNSMPHDSRINFGHPTSIQQASMPSPTCIPNKLSRDTYGACSSSISPRQSDTYGACSSSISPGQSDPYGACCSSISSGQSDTYGACSSSISPGQSDTYGACSSSISPGQSDTYGACSSSISPGQSDTYGACSSSISPVQPDIYGAYSASISPRQSDTYRACSSSISSGQSTYGACSSHFSPGQSVLSSRYESCSAPMNSMGNATMHSNVPTLMANHMNNGRQFGFPQTDIVDERNALDMFNTHVDSGVHNSDNSSAISNFLESELPILEPEIINNDMHLQLSEPSESQHTSAMNVCNSNRVIPPYPPMLDRSPNDFPTANMNFFNSDFNVARPGSMTFRSPRRRGRGGRRGRRRKANANQGDISMFQSSTNDSNASNDVYSVPPSTILEYGNTDSQNSIPKRICDMKELPADYSLTRYRSELKMSDNQKKDTDEEPKKLVKSKRVNVSIEEELKFLGSLSFPPANVDKIPESLINKTPKVNPYLQSFEKFIANWKSMPRTDQDLPRPSRSKQEHKGRHKSCRSQASIQSKFVIRMGRCNKDNPGQWVLKETCITPVIISDSDDESASTESVENLKSSHNITPEADKNKKSKSGNSSKVSKHSAKKKHRDSVGHSDRYNDLRENPLNFTNYETLPAGELKIKKEIISDDEPSTSGFEQSIAPKKRGRKSKNATPVQTQPKKIKRRIPVKAKELPITDFVGVTIKQEPIDEDDEVKFECSTRVLRSRKDETVLKEPQPGSSIKKEPLDYSSDEIDLDDSDSDPAWIPSVKQPKVMDNLKHQIKLNPGEQTVKKRRRKKIIRKNNSNGPGGGQVKKEKTNAVVPKKKSASEKAEKPAAAGRKKRASGNISTNVKAREKVSEYFVIAKSDLDKKIPYIWRLDKETNILQRYDGFTDHTGIVFHRNTNTYAAWNEMSSHNYLKINVKFITRSHMHCVVQYLGTVDEITLENDAAFDDDPNAPKRNKVEIFLQILLSQALDPTFLLEIVRENDLYFLDCIREMERITGLKKQALVKVTWDQELRKSADNYPRLNMLDCIPNEVKCQACQVENGSKLLQFYGQPYDHTSLGPVDSPLSINTHFNVCNSCSTAVSLYSHLHHLKFNYFIECNSKLNEARSAAKGNADLPQLLDNCLQDHQWVNLKFKELRKIWSDCERAS